MDIVVEGVGEVSVKRVLALPAQGTATLFVRVTQDGQGGQDSDSSGYHVPISAEQYKPVLLAIAATDTEALGAVLANILPGVIAADRALNAEAHDLRERLKAVSSQRRGPGMGFPRSNRGGGEGGRGRGR